MFNGPPGQSLGQGSILAETKRRAAGLIESRQYGSVVALLRPLLKTFPRDPDVVRLLGLALSQDASHDPHAKEPEGFRLLRLASQLQPNDPDFLCDFMLSARKIGRMREAHQAVDSALKVAPGYPRAVMLKANLLESSNRVEEALDLIKKTRAKKDDPALALGFASLCRHLKRNQEGVDALRPLVDDTSVHRGHRSDAHYILALLYDALGEFDLAFKHAEAGNNTKDKQPASDFSAVMKNWTRENIAKIPVAQQDTSRAVFVIGMPRSGTTLTEMIIGAHAQADGVGESQLLNRLSLRQPFEDLNDQSLIDSLSRDYLDMLQAEVPDDSATRVVDKMPENYIRLGFASRILPGATVIHTRRDARDNCLSIYFQNFGPWIQYATDQKNLAQQYLNYLELMDHWREHLDITIHDSVYEELTADPEPQIRALLDHAGLPFDKACLEPHKAKRVVQTASIAQVRNPIYRSSNEKWRRYEKHLGPMLEILEGV